MLPEYKAAHACQAFIPHGARRPQRANAGLSPPRDPAERSRAYGTRLRRGLAVSRVNCEDAGVTGSLDHAWTTRPPSWQVVAELALPQHCGLFVPKPSHGMDCQRCGVLDLGTTV